MNLHIIKLNFFIFIINRIRFKFLNKINTFFCNMFETKTYVFTHTRHIHKIQTTIYTYSEKWQKNLNGICSYSGSGKLNKMCAIRILYSKNCFGMYRDILKDLGTKHMNRIHILFGTKLAINNFCQRLSYTRRNIKYVKNYSLYDYNNKNICAKCILKFPHSIYIFSTFNFLYKQKRLQEFIKFVNLKNSTKILSETFSKYTTCTHIYIHIASNLPQYYIESILNTRLH